MLLLALLSKMTSLSIERKEKIPRRITAMTYTCPEWLGNRNFGMPELNSLRKTSGVRECLSLDTHGCHFTFGYFENEYIYITLLKNVKDFSFLIFKKSKINTYICIYSICKSLYIYVLLRKKKFFTFIIKKNFET